MRSALFIHGMWSRPSVWRGWISAFEEAGYRCAAVALPGRDGGAELSRVGFGVCVERARAALVGLRRPVVVGHSLGGLIVQKLAEQAELSAAVLINSAAPRAIFPIRLPSLFRLVRHVGPGAWRRPLALSQAEADGLLFNGLSAGARRAAYAQVVPESGRLLYELAFGPLTWHRRHHVNARSIHCPMLALAGREDRLISASVSRAIARYYGPRLTYREYPGRAHWLLAEPGVRERIDEVLAWLSTDPEQRAAYSAAETMGASDA